MKISVLTLDSTPLSKNVCLVLVRACYCIKVLWCGSPALIFLH